MRELIFTNMTEDLQRNQLPLGEQGIEEDEDLTYLYDLDAKANHLLEKGMPQNSLDEWLKEVRAAIARNNGNTRIKNSILSRSETEATAYTGTGWGIDE